MSADVEVAAAGLERLEWAVAGLRAEVDAFGRDLEQLAEILRAEAAA